ncbi:MAG: ABC transporter ATP-binding protein [Actinomycetota bacterium]
MSIVASERQLEAAAPQGAWRTLVRGLQLSPEFRRGLGPTLVLAVLSTAGTVIVPIAVQQTIDRGLLAASGPNVSVVLQMTSLALGAVAVTTVAGFFMHRRLVRATENALSNLRVRSFGHIHDLSVLHHASEHRGTFVARVTADVDTISQFMEWSGIGIIVMSGQLVLATAVMLAYSWQLALVVIGTFVPLVFILRWFQSRLSALYDAVRARVGEMLTAVSETVMGAQVIKAYGIEPRADRRVREAIDRHARAGYRAGRTAAMMFSTGGVFSALATALVVVVGVETGLAGSITAGRLIAFLFLVSLFVAPVQVLTEVLDQAQNAISGWRKILGVLDTVPDVADPAGRDEGGRDIPEGPISVRFDNVRFRYPTGGWVLEDVTLEIGAQSRVAVVGETGSGKTTFAKLLTRLMDPTEGHVLVNGAALADVEFAYLRKRVVMVPQDGFLFDDTILANVRRGSPAISEAGVVLAFAELGLAEWLEGLPNGLETRVGERGEMLSVGERQLVALARAYVANPDLLLLDEATSAVDPATEVRIQRALEGLTRGRTTIAIAHRLSTAEAADEVIVFDKGRVVQRGHHRELLDQRGGVYEGLHKSWSAQSRRHDGGTA